MSGRLVVGARRKLAGSIAWAKVGKWNGDGYPNVSYFWGVNLFSPSPRWTAATHRVSSDRKAFGKSLCTPDRGPSTLSLGLRVWMVVKET